MSRKKHYSRTTIVHPVSRPGRGVVSPSFCGLWHGHAVQVIGRPVHMEVERSRSEENIDHFWITIQVPQVGRVLLAVNTTSIRNRREGFDDRLRIGVINDPINPLPTPGISRARLLDYETIEQTANVYYEYYTRLEIEEFLRAETTKATWIQAWGFAFCRTILGVHQIHCRRASCAVPEDLRQTDGGLRFYQEDEGIARTVLLKFCGQ